MNTAVAEALLLVVIVSAASTLAAMVTLPLVHHETLFLELKSPSTGELVILCKSGNALYANLKILMYNATNGSLFDELHYDPSTSEIKGTHLSANVDDGDGFFNAGNVILLRGIPAGSYEVVVVNKDVAVYDGLIEIR